jgi:micrococcal nuclease
MALLLIACTGPPRQPAPPTPTAGPVVVATVVPTAPPSATRPAPTPIAPPTPQTAPPLTQTQTVYVTNTAGQGLTMRRTPGGAPIGALPDGAALTLTGEEQPVGDRLWRKVRDAQGREGWVAADFLTTEAVSGPAPSRSAASPAPGPATATPPPAEPTWPVPLIPTATLRQADAFPTRTPRPRESPAPILAPTLTPVIVPATKPAAATKPALTGNCHSSYPDFCIPPPPPDLDCNSALLGGRRRFTVRPPDPHLLDGNKDGIGCE